MHTAPAGLRNKYSESEILTGCFKLTGLFVNFTVNIDSTVGAVGFVPRYAWWLYPVALIRVDETTGEPIRGKDGLCVHCEPGKL
jgi:hypothetical protein